jgi:hypothetical protein
VIEMIELAYKSPTEGRVLEVPKLLGNDGSSHKHANTNLFTKSEGPMVLIVMMYSPNTAQRDSN